jgi:peptidoglycan/xylan/chitin deacetylase (PgdA/CDA1 family)
MALVVFAFSFKKIEAPQSNEGLMVKNINDTLPKENIIETPSTPSTLKYKIVSRSVAVPVDITSKEKSVLLTIDDGPTPRTIEVMAILKKHNANAIFFINGNHDKDNIGVIEQINNEGFSVGNHTWSHLNLKKEKDPEKIEKEINKTTDLITKLTGIPPRFFRAPYGESNPYIRKIIQDDGMIFMDWSGATMDWNKSTEEKDVFVNNVMNNIHSGSIILIHEHPWSVTNLDALLTTIESKGYTYIDPKNIIE